MKLIIANEHIVFEYEGENYLIDTGSPISFSFFDKSFIEINQTKYYFSKLIACQKSEVDELTGMNIFGVIGMDVVSQTGLIVDYENSEINFEKAKFNFEDEKYASISISLFMGSYVVTKDIYCNGIKMNNCVIDSGACISYVKKDFLKEENKLEEKYSDYSPMIGTLSGNYYTNVISTDEYELSIKAGELHPLLACFFDGIIGFNALSRKFIFIDLEDRKIIFKK